MDPVTGIIETKAAESAWTYIGRWFTRDRDQKKEIAALKVELAEAKSERLAFQKLMSELECRPDDDNIYWKKDGTGGPYCPTCIHGDEKLMPLTHGHREGSFYCRIHDQHFETLELRERDRQTRQNRFSVRRPSRFGRNSRMR